MIIHPPPDQAHESRSLKLLFTGAHPGDPEYACGGTIARCADLGHEAALLYLNRGEGGIPGKSAAEAAAIRSAEAQAACEILHACPLFAGQIDGASEVTPARYAEYRAILAQVRPDVVFAHWPIDNHPDHRVNALLVYDAWQWLKKSFTLYYYEVSNGEDTLHFSPNYYIDVTPYEARKRAACFAHASQSPERFYALQDQINRFRGIESGCQFAEAYIRIGQGADVL